MCTICTIAAVAFRMSVEEILSDSGETSTEQDNRPRNRKRKLPAKLQDEDLPHLTTSMKNSKFVLCSIKSEAIITCSADIV